MQPVAVYVHIPFCPTKCGYCDFNSYAMEGEIMERTTRAILQDLETSPAKGRPAKTIFFGGGTPTHIPKEQLTSILKKVMEVHPPIEGAEITSEANPGTIDAEKFAAMREAGFNRLSLGAQSFKPEDLIRLGRIHQANEIERAVKLAREAGFTRINLDLMFALPGQTRKAWQHNLEAALALQPEHLSLYCLTLEPNTPFYKQQLRGELIQPDEEEQRAMYEACEELLGRHGLLPYEISNYAKPGEECQHNLCYWRGEEYAGYGPGAVGALNIEGQRLRTTRIKHPVHYSAALETGASPNCEEEILGAKELNAERIMLGIRLNETLNLEGLKLDQKGLDTILARGWATQDAGGLQLTKEGRHFCSEVAVALLP
ncbi:MAG: radical SAM family heme chaperone HemW [Armatimonadetes bacterium]|nr:radical SAM family heme chaperone HemW [Armatimonadota bacterium]